MSVIEIIICGIGLAMDASTVAMTNGLADYKMKFRKLLFIALTFGIFQGIMPIFGYYSGKLFEDFIKSISHYVAFVLLMFLGIRMLIEAFKKEESEVGITYPKILLQGVATSIDALLIGVVFALKDVNIFSSSFIISLVTFICCMIAIYLGRLFGELLKNKAEILGGIILIVIAIRILLEGLA